MSLIFPAAAIRHPMSVLISGAMCPSSLRLATPPYRSLPALRITVALGQGVVYTPFAIFTMAMSPFGEMVPVMLLQLRVL